ncbi:oxidoreductase [Terriglobus aquaticus]|uniref:Oxidoreductase n=1 Tax=Terriglobus aquaticus TaxID=940139 RepID=A0ABW9KN77_9BACT|nr:oxidoreductase [Terriglobus aquaticus]
MSEEAGSIRVGLIGYGYVGRTFHAPLVRSVPGLTLTVVGSSRPAEVLTALLEVEVVGDPLAVATHPDVDLVVIASPNQSHYPLTAAALRAGKHVVCDKPFTLTLAEAQALNRIADEQDRLLSVFHNRRWDSEVLATRAVIASGMLGEISLLEIHMDRYRPNVRKRWRESAGPGAGLWFDLGPHLIDQALQQFGMPETVSAQLAVQREGGETDDWAHVVLAYGKTRVILHATLLAAGGGMPRTVVHGTQGSWAKFGGDLQEARLQRGMRPDEVGFGDDPDPGWFYGAANAEPVRMPPPGANQRAYYVAIREAIRGRGANPVPASEAVAVMAVLETCFESAQRGMVLPVRGF